ncbi:GNAT family N-acetyltransferase [Streptomyces sp. NPDC093595]|uniref:GNAT family N-acetyltransferase n=1 Tax=Streptomyces sp. NPDC093595 TaxID=3366045 RepID=UPI0038196E67
MRTAPACPAGPGGTPRRGTAARTLVVDETLPPQWPDRTFLTSPAWLRMMGDRPPGTGYWFRLVEDGVTVAATTGYLIEDPHCYESFNIHDLLFRDPPVFPDQRRTRPVGRTDRAAWFPCLAIVQPGYDADVVTAGEPAVERTRDLLAAVTLWARNAGVACAAVLYAAGTVLPAALAAEPAWHRVRGTVRSVLDVPPGSFDDYVAGLTKTSRQKVRWDVRDLALAGVRTAPADAARLGATELRLRLALIEKYGGYSTEDVERSRLERLTSLFPTERLRLFHSTTADGDVVGFSLFIGHGDQWHVFWCGFDYGNPASRRTYFDAMFYSPVRTAQKEGVRLIDYGLGYERSKKWRGCRGALRDIWVMDLRGHLAPWMERAAAGEEPAAAPAAGHRTPAHRSTPIAGTLEKLS